MIVKLYPKIIPSMPVHERTHAFQVNKLALKDLPTNLWLVIDMFGAQLNASSTVKGILSNWRCFFQERWMDFGHLLILSFHNSQGARMDNTTTAANAQVFLPIQNGPLAGCHKQEVQFVQVQCTLDFAPFIMVDPYPVSFTLHVLYYIKLPQSSQGIMNGSGVAYNLNSYLGPADLWTLTPEVVRTTILSPVLQDSPVLLEASDFNLQNRNTNASGIGLEIDGKILKLAWHQLCASIFNELCPGYSNQPQAALEHIKQSYINADGNNVCIPVFAYYQRMMNAICPFTGKARFPKSVCNALIDSLDNHLAAIFRRNYVDHAVLHDLQASYQHPLSFRPCNWPKTKFTPSAPSHTAPSSVKPLSWMLLPSPAKPSRPLPVTRVGTLPMVVPLVDTNPTVVPLVDIGPTVVISWTGWVDPTGSATLDDVIAALVARASTLG
jgi:hypothetical protein